MTPFGQKIRKIRAVRNITLKDMAAHLQVSPAYLSALEHGRRGRPSRTMVHQICAYFNIIWDEAEELLMLAKLSHPKVTVDTSGLSAEATELANRLAQDIKGMNQETLYNILKILK